MSILKTSPLKAEEWEVFYKDGKVFSSKESEWSELPKDGVLTVLIWHEYLSKGVRKKTILSGHDYYLYVTPYHWGDSNNYKDVAKYPHLRGVWTTDDQIEIILRKAFEKLDFEKL